MQVARNRELATPHSGRFVLESTIDSEIAHQINVKGALGRLFLGSLIIGSLPVLRILRIPKQLIQQQGQPISGKPLPVRCDGSLLS